MLAVFIHSTLSQNGGSRIGVIDVGEATARRGLASDVQINEQTHSCSD